MAETIELPLDRFNHLLPEILADKIRWEPCVPKTQDRF